MADHSRRQSAAGNPWTALARQMRLFRLLLTAALMFSGWHVARGTWVYFGGGKGHDPANGTFALVPTSMTAAAPTSGAAEPSPSSVSTVSPPEKVAPPPSPSQGRDAVARSAPPNKPEDGSGTRPARQRLANRHKAAVEPRGRDGGAGVGQGTKATWLAAASDVGRWLAAHETQRDRTWRETRRSVWGLVAHGLRSHARDANPPGVTDARHVAETSAAGPSLTFPASPSATTAESNASTTPPPLSTKPIPSPEGSATSASFSLTNPRESGGPVRFLLNGGESVLQPGETQRLSPEGTWLIEFHRGGDFGEARYTLTPGAYRFRVTRRGWDLLAPSAPQS